jgi:hypothetical protein
MNYQHYFAAPPAHVAAVYQMSLHHRYLAAHPTSVAAVESTPGDSAAIDPEQVQ